MTDRSNSIATDGWHQQLVAVLEQQQALLGELGGLAAHQGALIAGGRTDELLTLLGQRQRLIDRFTTAQHRVTELSDAARSKGSDPAPPNIAERIRSLLGEIDQRLQAVMHRDHEDQQALYRARQVKKRELHENNTAAHARKAYVGGTNAPGRGAGQDGTGTNRFADQRG